MCPLKATLTFFFQTVNLQSELGSSIFISGGQPKSPEGKHFSKGPMAFGAPNHFGAQDFL